MWFFDKYAKKNVSYETAGQQLLAVIIGRCKAFFDTVIPAIAKDLNIDLDNYDENILSDESMFVYLWAATKALEGDKHELIESIHNSFFDVFDNKTGELRAAFTNRCNRYNTAWDYNSGSNQSILAMNILSEIFFGGKIDERSLNYFAAHRLQMCVFDIMKNVLEMRFIEDK